MSATVEGTSYWSYPAGQGTGMVWMGTHTCSEQDIEALKEVKGDHVGVDELSLPGLYHPEWNSEWYKDLEPTQRPGGLGSPVYESQWCGSGVKFAKEPIWHYRKRTEDDPEGDPLIYVKEVPPNCGAYHEVYDGDGFINMHGPEPGSEAAEILDRRAYHWCEDHAWYYPGPNAPEPWW